MTLTIFVCHQATPEAWAAQLSARGEREMAEWERDEDADREQELALEHAYAEDPDDWPWYAADPVEVEDPEVIDDADLFGLPVADLTDGDEQDEERAIDEQEGEDE